MGQCTTDTVGIGYGLYRATSEAADNWNLVGALVNTTPTVSPNADTSETTDSIDTWKTYRRNRKDGGSLEVQLNYLPDDPGQLLLKADWDDKDCPWPYALYNPTSAKGIVTEAVITAWGSEIDTDANKRMRNITLKLSGPVTDTNTALTVVEI